MAPASDRAAQRFPTLSPAQLEVVARFSNVEPRRFAAGESLFTLGECGVPAWFLLDGSAELFGRDGLDQHTKLRNVKRGEFTGELHQLTGGPALAGATAGDAGCIAIPFDAERLRALIVGAAELGEMIMRAFILRRVSLMERGVGPVLLGRAGSPDLLRLQTFLTRNAYPHLVIDCSSERGRQMIDALKLPAEDLPLLICACGRVLKKPTNEAAGVWLGITPHLKADEIYDVAVIGAGPAGLATAVYAASEGLSVLVLDGAVLGGQAGASARIENYLGFPTGISGLALTGRALNQALKFGAQVAIPLQATEIRCPSEADGHVELSLSEQGKVHARTVVVASGARYKRLEVSDLKSFEGNTVHYWASPAEAKLCTGEEVALVGAGNSAGQAVVYLAPLVRRLTMIVRGSGLEASMSKYLIDRIKMLSNVEVIVGSEVAALAGGGLGSLEAVTVRERRSGSERAIPARQLFMFIGAEPNSSWLEGCVTLDDKGYILTGGANAAAPKERYPLQTSLPRIFAIGDVRSGSTKRVASAVGEGAAVVAQIHSFLGASTTTA
ncbi:MAG TPA: FAD-dependent oxidoreductase [Steroidobacteraceae bacterium]